MRTPILLPRRSINWVVKATWSDAPLTGPYTSCKLVVVLLMLTLFSGCTPGVGGEPEGPARAEITFQRADLAQRERIPLDLHFTPRQRVLRAELRLEAKGAVAVEGVRRATWTDVEAGPTLIFPIAIRTVGTGEGELRACVDVYGESGQVLYQVAPGVDFLVHDDLVLAGHEGTLELKLEYLEVQLSQGKISREEYEKERKRLLGGGATTGIRVEEPKK